ncbi:MAG TPA: dihydroorotase [Candidatus Cloacimonadota bacterium]|jgi:dihydroorotase|nr:dihydroorotase [Candidatus Cloacimonadota bacterium]HOF59580.1 dihydroorotase [Candidatus Cloacimonadota bacterium]HOR58707.1 dihydroorotase [Candidatus Cloacimonadota bacterium]HPB08140.1 dihydroorotase [Candidatus Cloacimonadota bacterium]HQL13331.1 dihydroorotase [Candidatus Cloacimonadota bacterium]
MTTLIKNGTAYIDGAFVKKDILIEDKLITRIEDKINEPAEKVIDAKGMHVFPGFVDIHVHLRDPGQTYKEDIVSGTRSAARGGFTSLCAMPNTDPVVDNIATVDYIQRRAKDLGSAKVYVIGAMTKKSEGLEISEMATMKSDGIVAVSDDGKCVQNAKLMLNCMRYATNFGLPLIVHAEDYNLSGSGQIHAGKIALKLGLTGIPALAEEVIISRDIMLAENTGSRLHIAHISTARSIELVREAKQLGFNITCEVTPHHLILTEDACLGFDTNTKMKPPLRTEADRQACVQALKDGIIDCIATDHAPHADFEKVREFDHAPFGVIGLETAFPALYHHLVKPGHISLERIVDALTSVPASLLDLPPSALKIGYPADICLVDLNQETSFEPEEIASKSKNTPWLNQKLSGKVIYTILDGRITWEAI